MYFGAIFLCVEITFSVSQEIVKAMLKSWIFLQILKA